MTLRSQQRHPDAVTYEPNPQQGQPPYPPPRGYPPPQYGPPPPQYGPPPPPAKKKSSAGKILLITFAAIIVLCGGGILIVALAAGGAKPSPSSGGGGGAAHAGMNQPARDGKFEFTVTKMQCGVPKVGDDVLGQTAQGQFCLITVTVKNIGNQPQTFDGSDQKAHDAAGTTFGNDTQAELAANSATQTFLQDINPGNAVTGVLVFDIPKTATIKTLELHDSPFSGGVIVTVA